MLILNLKKENEINGTFVPAETSNEMEAILKARDLYDRNYEYVMVFDWTEEKYNEFVNLPKTMDEFEIKEWLEKHYELGEYVFNVSIEEVPYEVYFKWQRADKDIEGAIFYYEHSTGNKVEDGCSMQVGKDPFGDYWFAFDEEDEDIIEDDQSFHNSEKRDVRNWKDWYKREWIIEVTKPEIERLAKYENRGYKWIVE